MAKKAQPVAAPRDLAILHWQASALDRVRSAAETGRLPHALLLQGPPGVGKQRFAAALAAALLCQDRKTGLVACGECPECQLTKAGSHPDLHWLKRPEDRKSISVDQVRELSERLSMTSMRRGHRVAIIEPAHLMTRQAQNALLKTLEEPPPATLLMLVTATPSRLLPTLRSRCQRVEIASPPRQVALGWLAEQLEDPLSTETRERLLDFAGGAPLKALSLAPHFEGLEGQMGDLLEALMAVEADVTTLAGEMLGEGLPVRLDWLEKWLERVLRLRSIGQAETGLTIPGNSTLQRAGAEVNISAAFRLVDRVREARRLLDGSSAPQLLIETLLLDFAAVFAQKGVNR